MDSSRPHHISDDFLDKIIIYVSVVLTVFTLILLATNLYFQYVNYERAISQALSRSLVDYGAVLSLSRAYDFAVIKTSGLFLGYGLIMLGSIFVLRRQKEAYEVGVGRAETVQMTLKSSSPGLIMITLGVFLMCAILFAKQTVKYVGPDYTVEEIGPSEDAFPSETRPPRDSDSDSG